MSEITKITDYSMFLKGTAPLPAGAVPLASKGAGLVCLMPTGVWIYWLANVAKQMPRRETQRDVVNIFIEHMGGTAGQAAAVMTISVRTMEAWRSGVAKLPISKAYEMAEHLSA